MVKIYGWLVVRRPPLNPQEMPMSNPLPTSVRYVKNGEGGEWWDAAKDHGQVHFGWRTIPHSLLQSADMAAIESLIRKGYGDKAGATQDFNALRTILEQPSRHLWVTFEEGSMWWCTVFDGIEVNSDGGLQGRGHFWLTCSSRWSNHSIDGKRRLSTSELPGIVAATAGFPATICEPGGWKDILRVIRNEEDPDARAAATARKDYQHAIARLVARLRDKDFEVLVDLILARTGWARLAKLGGATEGLDIEVENPASEEIAFVQVKSRASQEVLDDYVSRFNRQRERYARMIFAVHSPIGKLAPPNDQPVQLWTGERISDLVVRLGLGDWLAKRV
jgi:hypothetical protein